MFSKKTFLEVNREERFFCAVLFHVILASSQYRERFFGALRTKQMINLDPNDFQIFVEAAILRDYWSDLGDPREYERDTHDKRRTVVEELLRLAELDVSEIDQRKELFFTPAKKLVSPGHWNEDCIGSTNWTEPTKDLMKDFKHAFNSKPDLLILSGQNAVMIEAKLESGFGDNQRPNQKLICRLVRELIPAFKGVVIRDIELTAEDASRRRFSGFGTVLTGLSWREVVYMLEGVPVDDFSKRCLGQVLLRYYS